MHVADSTISLLTVLGQVRPGCTAAFQVSPTAAALLLEASPGAVVTKVELAAARNALETEFGLQLSPVLVLRKGSVPKTTSGKVRRKLCKQRYFGGMLPAPLVAAGFVPRFVSSQQPRAAADGAEEAPPASFTELLQRYGVEDLGKSLVDNGVDSLRLALLVREAQKHFGITIHAADVTDVPARDLDGSAAPHVVAPVSAVPALWDTIHQARNGGAGPDSDRSTVYTSPSEADLEAQASRRDAQPPQSGKVTNNPTQAVMTSAWGAVMQVLACCFGSGSSCVYGSASARTH